MIISCCFFFVLGSVLVCFLTVATLQFLVNEEIVKCLSLCLTSAI